MPYNRPGPGVYVTNGGTALQHGTPQTNSGFVGVAVKQKVRAWSDAFSVQAQIDANEPYFLITKGVVQVGNGDAGIAAAAVGTPVYITTAVPGVLTTTTGTPKFGRIVEQGGAAGGAGGPRGCPAGKVRIDLDTKDSFV
jgi:hypothetical protein